MDKSCNYKLHSELLKPFKLIALDWDGTAVKDRKSDTTSLVDIFEKLLAKDVVICVITGTNVNNIDKQFSCKINTKYRHNLFISANRGSEVYSYDNFGDLVLLHQRLAIESEDIALSKIAEETIKKVEEISEFTIELISNRLNRRKLDLIPEWANPKKDEAIALKAATLKRFKKLGFNDGIKGVYNIIKEYAKKFNFEDLKITSDIKHLEIGLTDKSDSINWILENIAATNGIKDSEILIAGDEFGTIDGISGSDYRMVAENHTEITYFSVGIEPEGVPSPVIYLGGGPECFIKILDEIQKLHFGL